MSLLLRTKSFLALLVAVGVLTMGLGMVVALPSTETGESSMDRDEQKELERRFHEAPEWGFISRHGRTGRIQEIDSKSSTVAVNTPQGSLSVSLNGDTVIREGKKDGEDLTDADLAVGGLITVNGTAGDNNTIAAAEILVIDDSEDGFNIRPYSGEGSALVPVFP
jgi:hypothetical protein